MQPPAGLLSSSDCGMEIGSDVIYKGKLFVLRGLEPMSVPDRRAEVEDPESGELFSVPMALLHELSPPRGLSAEA
jgi:hypothetical protein